METYQVARRARIVHLGLGGGQLAASPEEMRPPVSNDESVADHQQEETMA